MYASGLVGWAYLALDGVLHRDHSCLSAVGAGHQRRLHLSSANAVATDIDHCRSAGHWSAAGTAAATDCQQAAHKRDSALALSARFDASSSLWLDGGNKHCVKLALHVTWGDCTS